MTHVPKKCGRMNELAWGIGIFFCALGIALSTKADFGLSMIAAPPYILHRQISQMLPWFSQGTAEYVWEFVLLILTCLAVRKFRWQYLLSFGTAVLFGFVLDGWLLLLGGGTPYSLLWVRILAFALGILSCSLGVAFFFRTKWPPQIYELAVGEIARRYNSPVPRVKLYFDVFMLLVCVLFALWAGSFTGVGIGTVITTAVNAFLIQGWGKLLDRCFTFEPRFPGITDKL